jgi:hypothetical protein
MEDPIKAVYKKIVNERLRDFQLLLFHYFKNITQPLMLLFAANLCLFLPMGIPPARQAATNQRAAKIKIVYFYNFFCAVVLAKTQYT